MYAALSLIFPAGGLDVHPFAIANAERCGRLGVNFDKRFADLIAQARDVTVLLVDELNHAKRR